MKNTIIITNPSPELLKLIRDGHERKQRDTEEIRKNWHLYFPKK